MHDPARRSPATLGVALSIFLAAGALVALPSPVGARGTSPNVVLILVDDMRWDYLNVMPTVRNELVHNGIVFTNAFVENPMCCPSRTTILTGNASHTTDVFGNEPPHGGYQTFHDAGEESSTLATWLHDAGYHTGLVGKYLNRYGPGTGIDGWRSTRRTARTSTTT